MHSLGYRDLQPYVQRHVRRLLFVRHDVEMPMIESIKRFIQMGMGVAIVPRMCVRWEVERKLLAEIRIRQLKLPRSLYLVSRRGARLSHEAVGLMRLLQA